MLGVTRKASPPPKGGSNFSAAPLSVATCICNFLVHIGIQAWHAGIRVTAGGTWFMHIVRHESDFRVFRDLISFCHGASNGTWVCLCLHVVAYPEVAGLIDFMLPSI